MLNKLNNRIVDSAGSWFNWLNHLVRFSFFLGMEFGQELSKVGQGLFYPRFELGFSSMSCS